jgi:hypothetical protein
VNPGVEAHDSILRSANFPSAVAPNCIRQSAGKGLGADDAGHPRIANPRNGRMQSCATSRSILSCILDLAVHPGVVGFGVVSKLFHTLQSVE